MTEKTHCAILAGKQLMKETRVLVEQSQASCRASRALLEALEESLVNDKMEWPEPDKCSSAPNCS
jgi:hypothetical protein